MSHISPLFVNIVKESAQLENLYVNTYQEITTHDCFSGWELIDSIIFSKIITHSANEFQCLDCLHTSKTKQNLAVHIEANHVDHPGVTCSICNKPCTTRDALRKHMVRYHSLKSK